VLKRVIYVQSRPAMSMKCVDCLNYILKHVPSEKPSESPTTDFTSLPGQISVWVALLRPLTTIEGAETRFI
jgi:hypothetical protein